jgi:SAM-dependent methyltransferase
MKKAGQAVYVAFAALLLCFASPVFAFAQEYEPFVGQPGKDVIWVPTPDVLVQAMLDAAEVTPQDFVMDLGSGDGRIVIAAAKRGARAVGIEFEPDMVALSRRNAEKEGVSDKASFINADLFSSDLSRATVITMYLLPHLNLKIRPSILDLKPGTRVVSHAFNMGDWPADRTIESEGRTAYLWIVPAKAEGIWTWQAESGAAELQLAQTYQIIHGTLKANGEDLVIQNGKLEGDRIHFSAGDREYSGRINGRFIEGVFKKTGPGQMAEHKWVAKLS